MTAVLIALIALGSPAPMQQRSIWDELKIKRTGSNGYEEYLDAIDEYRKAGIDQLMSELLRPDMKDPTYIQFARIVSEKFLPVIAKIQLGNQKPVFDPITDFGTATTFPHLAQFKGINKVIVVETDLKFANGATSAAVTDLISGLEFGDNAGRGTLIAGLVGIASHSILLRSLNRHWEQISAPDAIRLEKFVNNYFLKPNETAQIFQVELLGSARIIRREFPTLSAKEIGNLLSTDDENNSRFKDLEEQWSSLTAPQRSQIVEKAAKELELRNLAFQAMLVKPEKAWKSPIFPENSGLDGAIIEMFSPVYDQALAASARHRTQLRLLRLHSIIRQFRFEHDRLPETLAKLNKPLEILDPLTGESFMYEPKADLQYDLYSKGNEVTGRIDMLYRRAPAEEQFDPNRPPLLFKK